ncbi:hypothetical protein NC652_013962 [Populus alba x Populus x berolinensis]|uniref:Uncharacterized protein n=2 Tax=Populus TaxID=3689 RepID=A0A4U5QUS7_POPAL|nr:hypothetical protein NC652_013962 [Populus alba x Populus x berolinensis]KAJ6997507.1 hypothetical protein NC653_013928 [Populus alba x Populus x berolinensis]TKS14882.1 hypothetical protein D5086_0000038820 [Populus alba]
MCVLCVAAICSLVCSASSFLKLAGIIYYCLQCCLPALAALAGLYHASVCRSVPVAANSQTGCSVDLLPLCCCLHFCDGGVLVTCSALGLLCCCFLSPYSEGVGDLLLMYSCYPAVDVGAVSMLLAHDFWVAGSTPGCCCCGLLELQYAIAGRVGLLQLTYAAFAMDCCLFWMSLRALLLGFLQLAAAFCPLLLVPVS